MRKIECAGHLI